jgi:hypothetical protein
LNIIKTILNSSENMEKSGFKGRLIIDIDEQVLRYLALFIKLTGSYVKQQFDLLGTIMGLERL